MKIIGLDVGEKRIGIAKADMNTRIAIPVGYVEVNGLEWQEIAEVAKMNNTNLFVVGLPRSNEGAETQQSLYARSFAQKLVTEIPGARVRLQDESLTSVVAEERLKESKKKYEKGDIDAEAASIILQDFLEGLGSTPAPNSIVVGKTSEDSSQIPNLVKKEADKVMLNTKKAKSKAKKVTGIVLLSILLVLVVTGVGGFVWAKSMLNPVSADCGTSCEEV